MARTNYLNNRELMREIHKSKVSFCSFIDDSYAMYDAILNQLSDIDTKFINETLINKADRLTKELKYDAKAQNLKNGERVEPITVEDLKVEELVFRIMTNEHIPVDEEKERKAKAADQCFVKLNFPAFKHYVIEHYTLDENNNYMDLKFKEVGRSHWEGGLENGHFNTEHGAINDSLARMFMKLVERYAQRGNWRGYCIDAETEALTQRGWLQHDQITEDDVILSYDEGNLKWSSIKSIYRGEYDGLMHKLDVRGMDALITPEHKLVTKRGLVKTELLLESDCVILMGDAVKGESEKKYSNALVELVGWIVTEGCYQLPRQSIQVYQNPGPKADRIRNCLNALNFKFSEALRKKNLCFSISRNDAKKIFEILPEKNLSMDFILNLTEEQRELLIHTMVDGDGWRVGNNLRYVQKDKTHVDLFQALCAISGKKTNSRQVSRTSYGKPTSYYTINVFSKRGNVTKAECINFHGGKRNGREHIGRGKEHHPNQPTTHYKGIVWCPETEYGCFVARRNGKVYLTGNTYNEEMRGQALLQLSQVGLQFNEAKSSNPFSYYTETINNSFTRVLNQEKKNQNIRDDLLIAHNAAPSFSKQYEHEEEMRRMNAMDTTSELEFNKPRRGRKKKVQSF